MGWAAEATKEVVEIGKSLGNSADEIVEGVTKSADETSETLAKEADHVAEAATKVPPVTPEIPVIKDAKASDAPPGRAQSRSDDIASPLRTPTRGDRKALVRAGKADAAEARAASKPGLFSAPTTDIGDLKGVAGKKIAQEAAERGIDLDAKTLSGLTARAAKAADKGSIVGRSLSTAFGLATSSKVMMLGGLGYAGYQGYEHFVKPVMESLPAVENLKEMFSAGASMTGASMTGAGAVFSSVMNKPTEMFNWAADNLEYLGMNPMLAKGVVGLGTILALNGALGYVEEATGLNKVPMLGTLLRVALIAGTIAMAMSDEEPSAKAGTMDVAQAMPKQPAPSFSAPAPVGP